MTAVKDFGPEMELSLFDSNRPACTIAAAAAGRQGTRITGFVAAYAAHIAEKAGPSSVTADPARWAQVRCAVKLPDR